MAVAGRKGLYPLLQYQTEGVDFRWSRTRRVFRDYHLDWYFEVGPNTFRDPAPTKAFEGNCTGCHSTGFSRFQDPGTLEWLSGAVEDPGGAYNLDGLGLPEEVNLGCEVCHGPASEHVAWASDPGNAGSERRFVVSPEALSPSREMMICGRCHDRQVGAGPVATEEPLNAQGLMARPGTSRADHLANYVDATGKGPAAGSFWADDLFSKSHHQQYSDLLKSGMHRNDRILTTCTDCHDSHGNGPFEHHTRYDPDLSNSYLCVRCHAIDPFAHMLAKTGSTHAGNQTTCVKCHMAKTAKTGAGHYGLLLGTPTGTVADESITYWENDVSTHLFRGPPTPQHPSVAGVLPENAMPIPYTNSCGSPCHNISPLQFLDLGVPFTPPAAPEPDEYLPSGR